LNRTGTTYYVPNFGGVSISVLSLPSVPGKPARVTASAGVTPAEVTWQAPDRSSHQEIFVSRVAFVYVQHSRCRTVRTSPCNAPPAGYESENWIIKVSGHRNAGVGRHTMGSFTITAPDIRGSR
jgi:hypothetical protein